MELGITTSAVEGVGNSRRGNTSSKGRLKSLSVHIKRKHSIPKYFQVYTISQSYIYKNAPKHIDRTTGSI